MRHIFTIAIAAGSLAVAAFASTVTSSGPVLTQASAAQTPEAASASAASPAG